MSIKLEVDTDPPGGFETEAKTLLQPIPFSQRTYKILIFCRKVARSSETGRAESRGAITAITSGGFAMFLCTRAILSSAFASRVAGKRIMH